MSLKQNVWPAPERRAARRFNARCAARLRFVTGISADPDLSAVELWPSLICRTRDLSEGGVRLEAPVLRESDDAFFGIDGPVRLTLGLPTGVVEACGVAARYAKDDGADERGGFIVCIRLTDMDSAAAARFRAYLRSLSHG